MPPVNVYNFDSVRRTAKVIREAREVLQSSAPLNPRQRRQVESKVRILETQLVKESVLAKRVSVYKQGSK